MQRLTPWIALATLALAASGCAGQEFLRGSQEPGIDTPAMSTGLDKDDMQRALSTLLNDLRVSLLMTRWRSIPDRATVAVAPFINETTEHIDPQLDSMLSETETWLISSGVVRVIDQDRQADMIRQVEGARSPVFDPAHIPAYGRQLGVKYYITGKVGASDERTEDERRVQYFVYMRAVDVETSEVVWQQKAYITKLAR